MNQMTFGEGNERRARTVFGEAVQKFHAATTELERKEAADAIERSRGSLILDHGYTLEMLVEVIDEQEPEVA